MSRKENTKTKTPLRTIQFLNYEGLQIKYGTSDELIIVPLNITSSKVGDEGETDYKAFWKIKNDTFEIPPYRVMWKHTKDAIEVHYNQENNSAIQNFAEECSQKYNEDIEITFGVETYVLKDGKVDYVLWQAANDNKITFDSRKNKRSLSFKNGYNEKRKKRTIEQYIRDQVAFRMNLLNIEPKCAITGVTTEKALQATHIVAVKDEGFEYVDNGLLLRSDIHLLFDNELLAIDNKGFVHIDKKVKDQEYLSLEGKKISPENLDRIRDNLERANKLRTKNYKNKGTNKI